MIELLTVERLKQNWIENQQMFAINLEKNSLKNGDEIEGRIS